MSIGPCSVRNKSKTALHFLLIELFTGKYIKINGLIEGMQVSDFISNLLMYSSLAWHEILNMSDNSG